jgi:putative ABC transport system permease protein
MINVITPRVTAFGIAGNFELDRSKTFFGVGFVPSDRERMQTWDEYRVRVGEKHAALNMSNADPTRGVMGVGLAKILGLCAPLHVIDCVAPPVEAGSAAESSRGKRDFSALVDPEESLTKSSGRYPQIDLLAATSSGAPNVVSLSIAQTHPQPVKEADDNYVGMPLALAQKLLFGRAEPKVTSVVLQLRHTADLPRARARLEELFRLNRLDLEVHDFIELTPFYGQVIKLFSAIFVFIAIILCIIVLFSVANAMSMAVVERTNEIGTIRAMGVRREKVALQFLLEGSFLGVIGASVGCVLAVCLTASVNGSGLHWTPPGYTEHVPLRLLITAIPQLLPATWIGLVAIAAIAAFLPAGRASRLLVVDALRHV